MSNEARTRDQGIMDIDYSIRLYELHSRFYRRVKNGFSFVSLVSGTTVVATVMADHHQAAVMASIVLGLIPILDTLVNAAGKCEFFDGYRKRFCALKVKILKENASIEVIDQCLAMLYGEPCDEIEALRWVAMRDNLTSHGHADWMTRPLSPYEQFWAIMA